MTKSQVSRLLDLLGRVSQSETRAGWTGKTPIRSLRSLTVFLRAFFRGQVRVGGSCRAARTPVLPGKSGSCSGGPGLSQKAGQNVSFGGDFLLGLYFHVPFCHGKCPYCDFYSLPDSQSQMDQYAAAVLDSPDPLAGEAAGAGSRVPCTLAGAPPACWGRSACAPSSRGVREGFALSPGAEITLEANPTQVDRTFFHKRRGKPGSTRLSMGLQSANPEELRLLGRAHSPEQAAKAVADARAAGFENISLDLMLGLPGGSREKLSRSHRFCRLPGGGAHLLVTS